MLPSYKPLIVWETGTRHCDHDNPNEPCWGSVYWIRWLNGPFRRECDGHFGGTKYKPPKPGTEDYIEYVRRKNSGNR